MAAIQTIAMKCEPGIEEPFRTTLDSVRSPAALTFMLEIFPNAG
jgi:hypothetical protein